MKKFLSLIKNSFQAILQGKFLLRLNIGRYFISILYCMVMVAVLIWVSLLIDTTMVKVEEGKKVLAEQQDQISLLTYKTATIERRTEVTKRLELMGSDLKAPRKPATTIK